MNNAFSSASGADAFFLETDLSFRAGEPRSRAVVSCLGSGDMSYRSDGDNPQRTAFFSRMGIAPGRVVGLQQQHSQRVLVLEDSGRRNLEGDGLVTARRDLVLSITVADCLPIFLHDTRDGVIAIVHSGWRGTGIASEAVKLMKNRFGVRPGDLEAVIGPGIGPCCYDVPEERALGFEQRWGAETVVRRDGRFYLDLRKANTELLKHAGVGSVAHIDECTCCSTRLGSFRREGPDSFTRMVAMIGHFE